MNKHVIDKLFTERRKVNRTLQDVADDLGIHKTTLYYYEIHKSKPNYDIFLRWVDNLKLDIKELIK